MRWQIGMSLLSLRLVKYRKQFLDKALAINYILSGGSSYPAYATPSPSPTSPKNSPQQNYRPLYHPPADRRASADGPRLPLEDARLSAPRAGTGFKGVDQLPPLGPV